MKINLKRTARVAVTCGLGLALTFGGVAGAPATAFAAASAGITITKAGTVKYKVYKLIDGEFEGTGDKQTMTDPVLNAAFADTVITTLNATDYKTGIAADDSDNIKANKVIEALNAAKAAGKLEVTVNKIAKALQDAGVTPTIDDATPVDGTLTLTGANTTGYYLVAPDYTDADAFASTSASTAMLLPVSTDGKNIEAKISTPTIDKEVKDADGNDIWDKDWSDLADAGLVDGTPTMPTYKLTGTLPTNIGEYDTYVYKFVDTLPTGFDTTVDELADWNVSIKVGDTDITDKFKAEVATDANHTSTITWSAYDTANTGKEADLKEILRAAGIDENDFPTTKIVLEYTPKYDENDLNRMYKNQKPTLDTPQKNTAHLEFSNNPYTDGTGKTTDDETKLYSFNLIIKKIKEDKTALRGAEFSLATVDGKVAGMNVTANDDGTFDFRGLEADVEYVLTETKVPTGYKPIQPIHFKIKAVKSDDGKEIVRIQLADGSEVDPSNAATFEFTGADVNATITNLESSGIPETGAAGIAGGIVVGGVLIAVSAITMLKQRKDEQA